MQGQVLRSVGQRGSSSSFRYVNKDDLLSHYCDEPHWPPCSSFRRSRNARSTPAAARRSSRAQVRI